MGPDRRLQALPVLRHQFGGDASSGHCLCLDLKLPLQMSVPAVTRQPGDDGGMSPDQRLSGGGWKWEDNSHWSIHSYGCLFCQSTNQTCKSAGARVTTLYYACLHEPWLKCSRRTSGPRITSYDRRIFSRFLFGTGSGSDLGPAPVPIWDQKLPSSPVPIWNSLIYLRPTIPRLPFGRPPFTGQRPVLTVPNALG